MNQTELSEKINRSQQFVLALLRGVRRPSWLTAKALAAATDTAPVLWLEADPDELRQIVKNK